MSYLWHQISSAIPLIVHGDPFLLTLLSVTARVALVSTAAALLIGLPIGAALGLGRFRGRRALQIIANAGMALPPVSVGVVFLVLILPQGPLGSLRIEFTIRAVYVVQTILALPYVIALTAAAIQGLGGGLIAQARALGAGRLQLGLLGLREAKIGVIAAVLAALAATISEVGAVIIVGGNLTGTETLASALISEFTFQPNDPQETAVAILLLATVILLLGALTVLQQRTGQLKLRFRGE